MDWFRRFDVIVLALLLTYIVIIVSRCSYRCHLAARQSRTLAHNAVLPSAPSQVTDPEATDAACRAFRRRQRRLLADLNYGLGSLKSIAFSAPYLGLAGTCSGILSAFRGVGMEKYTAIAMIYSDIAKSLVTTAAGILVAIPAVWSHNYLLARMEASEFRHGGERSGHHFQVAQQLPLPKEFSELPPFALIAAPALAAFVAAYMIFPSFDMPMGLAVDLLKPGAVVTRSQSSVEPIVIELAGKDSGGASAVYVNSKKTWSNRLGNILGRELRVRPRRAAYVAAEKGALWADVANVIDIVERLHADVVLLTTTPNINSGDMNRSANR